MIRKGFSNNWLNRIGFNQLLITAVSVGILLLTLITTLVSSSITGQKLRERIEKEGFQLIESFTTSARLGLLYQSQVDGKTAVENIMAFPDIQGAAIYIDGDELLYSKGGLPDMSSSGWPDSVSLQLQDKEVWVYTAPVFSNPDADQDNPFVEPVAPELLGYVRLVQSKASLRTMLRNIYLFNLIASLGVAVCLLALLLFITNRVTKPVLNLAGIMRRAQAGEKELHANYEGTREIVEMESAFNTMMSVLNDREVELKNARDIALEAARVKGEFAANVSHELRTPMNGVLGMLELMSDMGLPPKQEEYLDIATSSAEALLGLIDDILDFSRSDAGKLSLDAANFNLRDLLEEITTLLSIQAHRKNLQLSFLLGTGVPSDLEGDAGRLRQVLVNLIGNGIKFTDWGEVKVSVDVLAAADPGSDAGFSRVHDTDVTDKHHSTGEVRLRFCVSDTGIGISDEKRATIFDAFSQADSSTTKKYGGTGLGLAISRQLVGLMQGEIGVESSVGKGAAFWFTVTLQQSQEVRPVQKVHFSSRVLLVDDNPNNLQFARQQLESIGINTDIANSGGAALDSLRMADANKYNLLLVDENISGVRADDLAHLISTDKLLSTVQIVLLVNRHSPLTEQYHASNIVGFLHKPIKREDVQRLFSFLSAPEHKTDGNVVKKLRSISTPSFVGARVLVVEDNRANQKVALGMLERLGCEVQLASSGREALDLLIRNTFDVVLMDCHMPEMDGYETTAQIRVFSSSQSRIPIIAMTANVQQGEHEKCIAVGMDDFLSKPLKLKNLRAALGRWIEAKLFAMADNDQTSTAALLANGDANQPQVLDAAVLRELEKNIGSAVNQMLNYTLEDLPRYLHTLEESVASGEVKIWTDTAHTIKGSAINVGAHTLFNLCDRLEDKGRVDDSEAIDDLLDDIRVETGRVCQALMNECVGRGIHQANQTSAGNDVHPLPDGQTAARVLVVDDDKSLRYTVRETIESTGHRVDEVANGEQALMYCERFMPDLILMDAVMPEMNGFDACEKILRMPGGENVTIVIVTGLHDEISISRAFAAGAMDYISKPINFAVLKKRVVRLLQAKAAESHVRQLAYNDVLTGLPNRKHFTDKLSEYINRPQLDGGLTAILFLDLDRFKLINDTFGHDSGDLLLKVVAERLVGCVRQGDIVSRFGGDEFVIMLSKVKSYAAIEGIAAKIQQALSRPFVFLGKELRITTSIGIATHPDNGDDINILLKNADLAMYRAKRQGNRYEFFESRMEEESSRRLSLENDLRGAIERGEMMLYYQPQANVKTGELIGAEALIRWQHPYNGFINPMEFIGLAEETGQIYEIGSWVLNTACRQLKTWQDAGYPSMRMAVNISGRQLDRGDLFDVVASALKDADIPAAALELEITESSIMENAEDVIGTLEKLKKMGVAVAVDDFGTGYSSLSYLRRFPIDLLKVDREFVQHVVEDKVDADIVTTIITLAHALEVKVLAEGVETEQQREFLQSQNCDYMQGYLYGKPMPARDFAAQFFTGDAVTKR